MADFNQSPAGQTTTSLPNTLIGDLVAGSNAVGLVPDTTVFPYQQEPLSLTSQLSVFYQRPTSFSFAMPTQGQRWELGIPSHLIETPVTTTDPDAVAYISRVEAAEQRLLSNSVREAINTLVVELKAAGVYSKLRYMMLSIGPPTIAGCRVPFVDNFLGYAALVDEISISGYSYSSEGGVRFPGGGGFKSPSTVTALQLYGSGTPRSNVSVFVFYTSPGAVSGSGNYGGIVSGPDDYPSTRGFFLGMGNSTSAANFYRYDNTGQSVPNFLPEPSYRLWLGTMTGTSEAMLFKDVWSTTAVAHDQNADNLADPVGFIAPSAVASGQETFRFGAAGYAAAMTETEARAFQTALQTYQANVGRALYTPALFNSYFENTRSPWVISNGATNTYKTATQTSGGSQSTVGLLSGGKSTGKWYAEFIAVGSTSGAIQDFMAGFAPAGSSTYPGNYANSIGFQNGNTTVSLTGVTVHTNVNNYAVGSNTVCMAIDFDTKKMWVGVDGVYTGGGNPETGANPTASGWTVDPALMPVFRAFTAGITITIPTYLQYKPAGFGEFGDTTIPVIQCPFDTNTSNQATTSGLTTTNTGVTIDASIKIVGAGSAAFDGTGTQYLQIGPSTIAGSLLDLSATDFTIEGYVYPLAWNSIILTQQRSGTPFGTLRVAIDTNGKLSFFMLGANGSTNCWGDITSVATAPLNTWSRFICQVKGPTATSILNGVARSATVTYPRSAPPSNGTILGRMIANSGGFMNGRIDDLRIWRTALY